jgi:hypothetical protein
LFDVSTWLSAIVGRPGALVQENTKNLVKPH